MLTVVSAPSSEFERVEALRRKWAPEEDGGDAQPVVESDYRRGRTALSLGQARAEGFIFFKCGGGRRVIRKRIGE